MKWKPIIVRQAALVRNSASMRIHRHKKSQAPDTHCTRKSPLPLLPSGPGGVGGSTSRETDT